ncbi:hypothetical protein J6O86_02970 [bacterium]|nr:hypothetical protein [bacterium]
MAKKHYIDILGTDTILKYKVLDDIEQQLKKNKHKTDYYVKNLHSGFEIVRKIVENQERANKGQGSGFINQKKVNLQLIQNFLDNNSELQIDEIIEYGVRLWLIYKGKPSLLAGNHIATFNFENGDFFYNVLDELL